MILKTSYTDRVVSGTRKFEYVNNGDGTYCIEDKSVYSNEGDYYGAADLNKQNYVCNKLEDDYVIVDELIAKIQTYGVTPSDNSPASIIAAINSIATTYYNNGRTAGRTEVTSHPNNYGLYTGAQYADVTHRESSYENRMNEAISVLNSASSTLNSGLFDINDAYDASLGYVTNITSGMSGSEAKTVRNNMKNMYEGQRGAFFHTINTTCAYVDQALGFLSI